MRFSLPETSSGDLLHLDCLRFLASAGIVIHHSHEFLYNSSIRRAATADAQGLALFVDLFFVISGFVIAHRYFNRMESGAEFRHYMAKRVFRLVPLHWLTLAVSILVWAALLQIAPASHGPEFDGRCIVVTALLLHAMVDCGIVFNGQSWSISAEMVAYVLFPVLVFGATRIRAFAFLMALAGMVLALAISSDQSFSAMRWDHIHPVLRAILSFSFGCGLWQARDRIAIPQDKVLLWIAFVLLVILMFSGAPMLAVLALVYGVAVLAVSADRRSNRKRLIATTARFGQLTYSIYMWHGLVILVVMNALGDKLLHLTGLPAAALALVTYLLIFAVSLVSYWLIERPSQQYLDVTYRLRSRPETLQ